VAGGRSVSKGHYGKKGNSWLNWRPAISTPIEPPEIERRLSAFIRGVTKNATHKIGMRRDISPRSKTPLRVVTLGNPGIIFPLSSIQDTANPCQPETCENPCSGFGSGGER
jgi:hypothetical protein